MKMLLLLWMVLFSANSVSARENISGSLLGTVAILKTPATESAETLLDLQFDSGAAGIFFGYLRGTLLKEMDPEITKDGPSRMGLLTPYVDCVAAFDPKIKNYRKRCRMLVSTKRKFQMLGSTQIPNLDPFSFIADEIRARDPEKYPKADNQRTVKTPVSPYKWVVTASANRLGDLEFLEVRFKEFASAEFQTVLEPSGGDLANDDDEIYCRNIRTRTTGRGGFSYPITRFVCSAYFTKEGAPISPKRIAELEMAFPKTK